MPTLITAAYATGNSFLLECCRLHIFRTSIQAMAADEEPSLFPPLTTGAIGAKQTKTSKTPPPDLIVQQYGIEFLYAISFVTPFSLATASVRRANENKLWSVVPLSIEISQQLEGARAAPVRLTARSQDCPGGVRGRGTLQSLSQVQLLDSPHWPWEPPTHHSHFASLPIALFAPHPQSSSMLHA